MNHNTITQRHRSFPLAEGKGRCVVLILVLSTFFSLIADNGLGVKVIRKYKGNILEDVMPWQIDVKDDWMFAATDEGVVQFDGAIPSLFPLDNHRPVRSVWFDNESQRLYAGGINEFGYFVASPLSSLEYVCLSDSIGEDRFMGNIWGVYPNDGMLILQADAEVVVYDLNTGKHYVISSEVKLDCSARIKGVLWLGTQNGLKFLMGNTIADAPGAGELKGKRIRAVLENGEGIMVVCSDGIWQYENQHLERLSRFEGKIAPLGEIFSAALKGNILALGSVDSGVGIIDLESGEMEIYNEDNGLDSNTVISLKFDNNSNLLTGLQYGMNKLLLSLPVQRLDNTTFPIGSGYVMTLDNDKLMIGTNRGLFTVDYESGKELSSSTLRQVPGLSGQVWGLASVEEDLFVCHDRGLFIKNNDGSFTRLGDITGVWDIQKMLGTRNRAIIGTYNGLRTLIKKNEEWQFEGPIEGYFASSYNFVQEAPGVIWSDDNEAGINRIEFDTLSNRVKDIRNYMETADGYPLTADIFLSRIDNDIIFSSENGIYTYNKEEDKIVRETQISRLLGYPARVRRVRKLNGSLYALTPNEVIEADPAGILDIKRIPISPMAAKPMHDKDLFAAIGKDYISYPVRTGYLFFDFSGKNDSLFKGYSPHVRINNIRVTSSGDSIIYNSNFRNETYIPELKYSENSIKIEYGSQDALNRGILYSTRLNKEPWSLPSAVITKEYTDLHEGKYKFEVRAVMPNGKSETDTFSFKILPPWWRTSWMWIIYILLLFGIAIGGFRLEQKRVERKQRRLAAKKDEELAQREKLHEREREAKDNRILELEKEKLDKELRHKAQEVANVMLSLSHKNETLQTVKKELQTILGMLPKNNSDARAAIQGLHGKVNVDLRSDDVLKRVEEEFDLIHDNFMKKLRARYPDLNNNEVLLCAYLKMNLSTKEIAPLLNISARGVETMRYRLRKKFNLDREEGLSEFLAKEEL